VHLVGGVKLVVVSLVGLQLLRLSLVFTPWGPHEVLLEYIVVGVLREKMPFHAGVILGLLKLLLFLHFVPQLVYEQGGIYLNRVGVLPFVVGRTQDVDFVGVLGTEHAKALLLEQGILLDLGLWVEDSDDGELLLLLLPLQHQLT